MIKLERIKKQVSLKYELKDNKWFFVTWFDKNWIQLFSKWVLFTDKTLDNIINDLYYAFVEEYKNISTLVCDIVWEIIDSTDNEELLEVSPWEYGFAVVSENWEVSGVVLPDTEWIIDTKLVLYHIRKKTNIDWNIKVYNFETNRILIKV
jgi:hypothetical protein